MKYLIELRVLLVNAFSWVAKNIRLYSFFMQVLASLTIGTVPTLMILLARLGFILDMGQNFGLELISTMGKATLVSKLASSSKFPVLAHLSLIFSSIFFNKLSSLFRVSEFLSLWADIYLKGVPFWEVHRGHTAWRGKKSSGTGHWIGSWVFITKVVISRFLVFWSVGTGRNKKHIL